MADSQQNIDWNKVHEAALECLHAIWELIWWAERSTEEDYDAGSAALHLAAIDRAGDTVGRAIGMFRPHHFNALAKASVGEGPRPDFQFGGVCCATAHESAFVLLRTAMLWLENGLWAQGIGAIDQLHELSAETLRDKLLHIGNPNAIKSLLTRQQSNVIKAWINREWAAVSRQIKPHVPNLPETLKDKRDKWIYKECMKLTSYQTIALKLKKKLKWSIIESVNGIKMAAERYATT